jgi:hypothetical protein
VHVRTASGYPSLKRYGSTATGLLIAVSALAVTALSLATPAAAAPTCVTSGQTVTCTYTFTGGEQSLALPAGVTSVSATAIGAAGGNGTQDFSSNIAVGGSGATASATLSVSSGQTLYIEVAGAPTTTGCYPGTACVGGFNGGGSSHFGGGGGGASDVRTVSSSSAGTVASRLIVAAGGGGGGEGFDSAGGRGGDAGTAGANAAPDAGTAGGTAGGAGTPTAGGAGGSTSGGAGGAGQGGAGGGNTGGGGGAGLFGGGGGGNLQLAGGGLTGAGGAGGGSSYAPGGTTGLSSAAASVVLVYTLPVTAPDAPTGVSAVLAQQHATVSWTAPASNHGAAITAYHAWALQDPTKTCAITVPVAGVLPTTCVINGLHYATAYTFVVSATNTAGASASSIASNQVTVQAAPVTPKPTPSVTPAAVVPAATTNALAATGANASRPLLLGVGLVGLGAAALMLAASRRRTR